MVNVSQLDSVGKYEPSLYKYWFRGFDVFYKNLQRNSIDPSIYKPPTNRLHGLAKLLVYERVATTFRNIYRNEEPTDHEEVEVAEWEVSIKYGEDYCYRQGRDGKWFPVHTKDEIYDQDLKLNEWIGEAQNNRAAYLHRHPAFVGSHTGRTPLKLAVLSSSPEIVDILINSGARLTVRLSDGRNSLHLAAARGDPEIVKILLLKGDQNEELKMERGIES
ncbi:uncharacterized protein DFL_006418 [Arthrobotrys flagrans]|uniref:Uncharacterized protein n=1 Tax=Arthrobotrys flagrans TaxID=97331 RepID=A0A437A0A6_ARTFL|nr:hypothetical protein DFL_006418 [Arthrobotrys flagrans]